MILQEFEGGIHTSDDLHKKFNHTIVYARPQPEEKSRPVYIKAIEGGKVYYSDDWGGQLANANWHIFELLECRPKTGIYNLVFNRGPKVLQRPVRVLRFPYRQWRFGINVDNLHIVSVNNRYYHVFEDIPTPSYQNLFEPTYPTFEEALGKILNHEVKHIAINSKISIMLGRNRILMFKNFVPFLAYQSGIPFAVNEIHPFVKDEHEKYANLLTNAVGQSKIK